MTYTARQVSDALDSVLSIDGLDGEQIMRAVADALPDITIAEMRAGWELNKHEEEIRDAEEAADKAFMEKVLAYSNEQDDKTITIGAILRRAAESGDAWAQEVIAEWDSPERKAYAALANAAAAIHPDWSGNLTTGLLYKDGSDDLGGDVDALVDWLQITHPELAKAVEDRAKADAQ